MGGPGAAGGWEVCTRSTGLSLDWQSEEDGAGNGLAASPCIPQQHPTPPTMHPFLGTASEGGGGGGAVRGRTPGGAHQPTDESYGLVCWLHHPAARRDTFVVGRPLRTRYPCFRTACCLWYCVPPGTVPMATVCRSAAMPWVLVLNPYAFRYRVIAPDMRGHGETTTDNDDDFSKEVSGRTRLEAVGEGGLGRGQGRGVAVMGGGATAAAAWSLLMNALHGFHGRPGRVFGCQGFLGSGDVCTPAAAGDSPRA